MRPPTTMVMAARQGGLGAALPAHPARSIATRRRTMARALQGWEGQDVARSPFGASRVVMVRAASCCMPAVTDA